MHARPFDRLSLFSFLWAIATLFHFLSFPFAISLQTPFAWGLVLMAVLLILNPRSVGGALLMLACSVSNALYAMPQIPNHLLFEFMLNAGILMSLGWNLLRARAVPGGRSEPEQRDVLFQGFAPFARISLFILYGYAVFHKLNYDYLNETVSCGAILLEGYANRLPFLPNTGLARTAAVWGTLLIETAIPLFLFLKPTRSAGILLGLGFHYFLAIHPHGGLYSFSALLFALFSLFLPVGFTEKLYATVAAGLGRYLGIVLLVSRWLIALGALTTLVLVLLKQADPYRVMIMGAFVWLGWGGLVIGFYGWVSRHYVFRPENPDTAFGIRPVAFWAVPALVLLNGMSPYLGLKTGTSFSMFSNLRTEGNVSNHVLVKRPLRLANWQDDLVEVVATDVERLESIRAANQLLTYFELKRMVSGAAAPANFYVTYRRGGNLYTLRVGGGTSSDPQLTTPAPWLLAKWIHFRPVDRQAPCLCKH